jgi:hypothetical protein
MLMSKIPRLIALGAMMAVPVMAQPPDLSGTWRLNLASSFLGSDHPAKDYEMTKVFVQKPGALEQTDIAVHVSMVNLPLPDSRVVTELVADGKEHESTHPPFFPGMPPFKMRTLAEWQGGTLLVTESAQSFGGQSTSKRRYFLSDDGLHLIELVEGHSTFGDTEQRLVFDKQPPQ